MSLCARDLVKYYGKHRVVNKVTVEVEKGEVVGLLGPNGAGKTTTFYMTVGLEASNSGSIYLDEVDVTEYPLYKRSRLGMNYLPQEASVFRKMNVEDNIKSILEFHYTDRDEKSSKLEELLDLFKLDSVKKQMSITLSGGERRRVEIARAMASDPQYLLLDEPFTGIDPIAVEDIQNIIKSLCERGIGILVTDHNVRDTLSIVDRAYIMYDGEILISGKKEDIVRDPIAQKYYFGTRFGL